MLIFILRKYKILNINVENKMRNIIFIKIVLATHFGESKIFYCIDCKENCTEKYDPYSQSPVCSVDTSLNQACAVCIGVIKSFLREI